MSCNLCHSGLDIHKEATCILTFSFDAKVSNGKVPGHVQSCIVNKFAVANLKKNHAHVIILMNVNAILSKKMYVYCPSQRMSSGLLKRNIHL